MTETPACAETSPTAFTAAITPSAACQAINAGVERDANLRTAVALTVDKAGTVADLADLLGLRDDAGGDGVPAPTPSHGGGR